MTARTAFTPDEWNQLRSAPAILAAGVSTSDPSGLFGSLKEAAGGIKGMIEALQAATGVELAQELLADQRMPQMPDAKTMLGEGGRQDQAANFRRASFAQVQQAVSLLIAKATPEEVEAYKGMLVTVATTAANAAKEGGFLGFGGERVSADEQGYLDELKALLSL